MSWQDTGDWRGGMAAAELPVCCVELDHTRVGTGFLVARDLVITNHHVAYPEGQPPWDAARVRLGFDVKRSRAGREPFEPVHHRLTGEEVAESAELDYLLLRVDGTPGDDRVAAILGGQQRGWLRPTEAGIDPEHPVLVLGFPKQLPLKLSVGSVMAAADHPDRLVYDAPTLHGSSGSPCFDIDWQLVALHHWGDPAGNRAVPFEAILADLPPAVRAELG